MRRLTCAAAFASTSSRFSDALISWLISARTASVSAGISCGELISVKSMGGDPCRTLAPLRRSDCGRRTRAPISPRNPESHHYNRGEICLGKIDGLLVNILAPIWRKKTQFDGVAALVRGVFGQLKDKHVLQIAVAFSVIEAVSDHKFIRDLESDVIGLHRLQPPRRLIEQCRYTERLGLPLPQNAQEIAQGQTGVENILDEDYIEAGDVAIEIFQHAHLAGRFLAPAVARDGDEVDRTFQVNLANEVGEKNARALQHANQVNALAFEVARNLARDAANPLFDLSAPNQDFPRFHSRTRHAPACFPAL